GAHAYVPRSRLQRRVPAIRREVADAVERRARRATEWLAAESARQLDREMREQKELLETLNRAGRLLSAELNLDKLAQGVTDAAAELSGAQFGAFFYNVDDERGERHTLYAVSGVPREAFSHFPMPLNTELFGPTFRGEAAVRIDDVRTDARYGHDSAHYEMLTGHLPVTSYLAVPVTSRAGGADDRSQRAGADPAHLGHPGRVAHRLREAAPRRPAGGARAGGGSGAGYDPAGRGGPRHRRPDGAGRRGRSRLGRRRSPPA